MKLKVGVIGVTHPHSKAHLRSLELLNEVEEIYLADDDTDALASLQDLSKVSTTFTNFQDLLRRDDIPVVIVLKRNDESVSVMTQVVEAGKHVITDKPAARTADELAGLLDLADKKNVLFSVFYTNRWRPELRQALSLRESGALGRLLSIEFRTITSSVSHRNPHHWLFNKNLAGGGILHWLGCHQFDLLRYLTGEEVTSVSAMTRTLSGESIDVEDVATVMLQMSSGALATLHAGYMIQSGPTGYMQAGYDSDFGMRGTAGRIWIEKGSSQETLALESTAPKWRNVQRHTFAYTLAPSEAYGGAAGMDFLRTIFKATLEGEKAPVTGIDALKALQIIEAAYLSSDKGKTITL